MPLNGVELQVDNGPIPQPLLNLLPPNVVTPTQIVSGPQFFSVSEAPYGLLGRSETTIGVAALGKNIVVGWNDADGFLEPLELQGLSGYGYSSNFGLTFTDGGGLPPGEYGGLPVVPRGDPWIEVGGIGNQTFFYANLASRPISLGFAGVGLIVHRGKFRWNQLIWDDPVIIPAPNPNDFLDKEAMATDMRFLSDDVYITVTNFLEGGGSQIELYRSLDGGVNWTGPTIVKEPDPLGQQGSDVAVGPHGELYVTWERGRFTGIPDILFKASFDQGSTFGPLQTVQTITGTSEFPPVGYNRTAHNDFPRIAVDLTSQYKGRIYVTYQDAGNNPKIHEDGYFYNINTGDLFETGGVSDGDIYVSYSDDHGATWSTPTLVSSSAPGDGKDQFWPVVSVQANGDVNVVYYQDTEIQPQPVDPYATDISVGSPYRRFSSYQSLVDVYWAQSKDGGNSFATPALVNNETSNWSTAATNIIPNYGDYIDAVSVLNRVYFSWAQSALYEVQPDNERYVPSVAVAAGKNLGIQLSKDDVLSDEVTLKPTVYGLAQNYPNPFNPETEIRFQIPKASRVVVEIYNSLGQHVRTLTDKAFEPGEYSLSWNGTDTHGSSVPSGVYFYKMQAGDFTKTHKMMLMK